MYLNFYNKFLIKIDNDESTLACFLKQEYKYYCSSLDGFQDNNILTIIIIDKVPTKSLYFIGKDAVFDDSKFYILDKKGKKLEINFDNIFTSKKVSVEENFDLSLFHTIFRSVIFMKLFSVDLVPVHSSCVVYNKCSMLIPAWGGTGKTRMLLKFIDLGAEFVSDEWTILSRKRLFTFFSDFKMFDYDIKEFPEYAKITYVDQLRLKSKILCKINLIGKILDYFKITLRYKQYDLIEFFLKFSKNPEINKLYFLQSYNGTKLKKMPITIEKLSEKIYQSFLRENRTFFYYYGLFKFANFKTELNLAEFLESKYKSFLFDALKGKQYYLLAIPLNFKSSNIDFKQLLS
jgi:hypothetical protein